MFVFVLISAIAVLVLVTVIRITTPVWSIKIFRSAGPIFDEPDSSDLLTPTIQAKHVTDVKAVFVADPFLLRHGGRFYLFYEVLNQATGKGEIAYSVSDDGNKWKYGQVILRENFHLSYPQVFLLDGCIYMLPETVEASRVILFKAARFPDLWEEAGDLLKGRYTDPSVFTHEGKWWMYAGAKGKQLHLFGADQLTGPWTEHPASPVVKDNTTISRPAGRVLADGESIYRYTQDGQPFYGSSTRIIRVHTLTETVYREEEASLVLHGSRNPRDWRKDGMHHIDQLQLDEGDWMIAVDGHYYAKRNYVLWRLQRLTGSFQRTQPRRNLWEKENAL
ncbi:glucosamine inositolphosphorylceramide transferase family protein [Paenibacillus swuensis]|uniref:glucosamine inositolphosphorylceramide transferase family protein n=1 Tax=Paenibacillus swuensis TaxID=1178515 RepID=UPI0008398195|nr:hypothetical protein [Paenibacillus swuensis]